MGQNAVDLELKDSLSGNRIGSQLLVKASDILQKNGVIERKEPNSLQSLGEEKIPKVSPILWVSSNNRRKLTNAETM